MLKPVSREEPQPEPAPALDKRFLVDLKGKEFVTYAGLLDLAHQHGLKELKVDLVQFPCSENGMECIVKAMAVTESGMMFCDIGDANPGNTNKSVAQHIIRMASTRAKARVLRDMTNIGITAFEELGDDGGGMPGNGNGGKGNRVKPSKAAGKSTTVPEHGTGQAGPAAITETQKRAIWTLAKGRGHVESSLQELTKATFGCGVAGLSSKEAASLITQLQKNPV